MVKNLAWYIQDPLLEALSFAGLILAMLGFVLYVKKAKKDNWLLITFPGLFLVFISSLALRWSRWVIPVIPFLSILAAYAWHRISSWLGERSSLRVGQYTALVLLLVLFAPLLRADTLLARNVTGVDTRTLARNWVLNNIPKESRILIESYTPQLPTERFRFFVVGKGGVLLEADTTSLRRSAFVPPYSHIGKLREISAVVESEIDYMILSEYYDLYSLASTRFREYNSIVKTYDDLMKMGEQLQEFRCKEPGCTGPVIRVYRFRNARK